MKTHPHGRPARRTAEVLLGLGVIGAFTGALWLGLDPVFAALSWLETRAVQDLIWALSIFFVVFAVLSLTTLPVVTIFCLAAGYLFGPVIGTSIALMAGTTGATLTYAMVRAIGGDGLRAKLHRSRYRNWLALLEKDVTWYLIVLRIIPVAPFFLINAAAGVTGISTLHFIIVTAFGLTPITVLYVTIGNGLETLAESRDLLGPGLLFEPTVGLPLLGLLALIIAARVLQSRFGKPRH